MTMVKVEISRYNNAFSTVNIKVALNAELENIRNGKYQTIISECREALQSGNKNAYSNLKKQLPALTFSGIFSSAHKKENLQLYSKFIVLDIDNLATEKVELEKQRLFEDIFVFSAWISPSGNGLKLLININSDAEDHALCFLCLSEYFKINYNIEIDKSGSDVCRLCFISYDNGILRKQKLLPFDFNNYLNLIEVFPVSTIEDKPKENTTKKINDSKISTKTQKALFYATEGKNKGRDRGSIEKIIKFLKKNNKSITSNYNDWFRVALSIANSFTYEVGQKYYTQLCELDNENYDEYKSKYMLDYCYMNRKLDKIGFPTIVYLAKQQSFKVS